MAWRASLVPLVPLLGLATLDLWSALDFTEVVDGFEDPPEPFEFLLIKLVSLFCQRLQRYFSLYPAATECNVTAFFVKFSARGSVVLGTHKLYQ